MEFSYHSTVETHENEDGSLEVIGKPSTENLSVGANDNNNDNMKDNQTEFFHDNSNVEEQSEQPHFFPIDEDLHEDHAFVKYISELRANENNIDSIFEQNTSFTDNHIEPPKKLTQTDKAQLDLLVLCTSAKVPLGFYDQLLGLLRKHNKLGFKIEDTKNRKAFIRRLSHFAKVPKPNVCREIPSYEVCWFSFLEQAKDLLSSNIFNHLPNLHVHTEHDKRFLHFTPENDNRYTDVLCSRWYKETVKKYIDDPVFDIESSNDYFILPVILYCDKTGTDVNQRFPLEPWMFTFAVLRFIAREKSSSWRHLGFIPHLTGYDSAQAGVQLYHRCLSVLLKELKHLQEHPPLLDIKLGDRTERRRVLFPIAYIIGDNKSQDNLCGRRMISKGPAGRIHRSCMCSSLTTLNNIGRNHQGACTPVSSSVISELQQAAQQNSSHPLVQKELERVRQEFNRAKAKTLSTYMDTRSKVASDVLEQAFTNQIAKVCKNLL